MNESKVLQDAMGLIDDIYIEEISAHRLPHRLRRGLHRWGLLAACFLLVTGLTLSGIFSDGVSPGNRQDDKNILPVNADKIIWGTGGEQVTELESASSTDMAQMTFHGWEISGHLYDVLSSAENDTYIAIRVRKQYDYTDQMNFVYCGKTQGEWRAEYEVLSVRLHRMKEFAWEGQWLQYGEALYTTGAPDGTRWTKELYEKKVDHYGALFIEQYVQNGKLLSEKLEADVASTEARLKELDILLVDLTDAYHAEKAHQAYSIFAEQVKYCGIQNDELYLFVTAKGLASLSMPQAQADYSLSLASRRAFEAELTVTVDETLTGFHCAKISFYTDGVRYNTVSSDAEVIEATKYLLERWQYTSDCLGIVIYASPKLTEAELAAMNYHSVIFSKYTDLILLTVKMQDLNLEAIRDLSLLPQVSSIHIAPTMPAENAG